MEDRITTIFDEKQRILDLTSYNFTPPSTGIYDEPVRFYKANIEWAKILEGHIDWLADVSAWKDASEDDYFAIQQVLIFLEGTECGMSDLTEILERLEALEMALSQMCEDVKCGVISGFEELAARVLLAANKDNVLSDIAIGKNDGTITIENPPSQPPGAVDASALEIANGYTFAVGVGVREFFSELNTAYLDGLSATQTRDIMAAIYILEDFDPIELEGAIADYFFAWNTAGASYIPNAGKVSEFVWLYGANKKTLSRYALYVQKEIDTDVGAEVFALVNYISSEQIAIWYQQGQGQPRNDYITYPDYRIANDTVILTPADIFTGSALRRLNVIFDNYTVKAPTNRWLYKVSGLITNNSLNRVFDGLYYDNASLVKTKLTEFGALIDGSNSAIGIETYPNYNPLHEYSAYYSQIGNNEILGLVMNGLPIWNAVDCTGQIEITRIDLGKVV